MRKHILFIFTSLVLLNIFVAINVQSVYAGQVGAGADCDADQDNPQTAACGDAFSDCSVCAPNFVCSSTTHKCESKKAPTCSCKDSTGNSSEIDCTGLKPIACGGSSVCKTGDRNVSNPVDKSTLDLKGNDSAYQNITITGVLCTEKKNGNATCKCGTDNKSFTCTLDSDTKQTAGGSCKDAAAQCTTVDPKQATDDNTTNSYTGFLDNKILGVPNPLAAGYTLSGIVCKPPPVTCTCEHSGTVGGGTGQNGFNCTQGQTTVHDFCISDDQACTSAPDAVMHGGSGSKSRPFNGADLQNITCADSSSLPPPPTEPPPPSPPCSTWSADGECTAFASAFGSLETAPLAFVKTIFAVLLSFSGGIALLLIIRAGYRLLTSQGKPEQINQSRDELVAAIVGLVFLIFAFVVLETIGVDILHLPKWTH